MLVGWTSGRYSTGNDAEQWVVDVVDDRSHSKSVVKIKL